MFGFANTFLQECFDIQIKKHTNQPINLPRELDLPTSRSSYISIVKEIQLNHEVFFEAIY